MNKKVSGIVIKSVEINEADKLVTLLTDSDGRMTVLFKSVKKASAKLKHAAEPFCFGEYELVEKGDRYIAAGFTLYELFYGIRGSLEKYYLACALLEMVLHASRENMPSGGELVALVSALRDISECRANIFYLAIKVILKMLGEEGFSIENFACAECGKEISGKAFFETGGTLFYCADCGKEGQTEIDKNTFSLLKHCVELDAKELEKLPFDPTSAISALRILYKLVYYKLFFKNESLIAFAKLINLH